MLEYSPEWWLLRLYRRLCSRQSAIARYEDYYEGRQPLAFVTAAYRAEFSKILNGLSDNWMELVVDAVEERLHVDGFRLGIVTDKSGPDGEPELGDRKSDQKAWGFWQANHLDADSEMLHSTALQTGSAYAMVWTGDDDIPSITVEHPSQTIVAYEPGSRRKRAAALKMWVDEWTGKSRANVYLPDKIYKYQSKKAGLPTDQFTTSSGRDRALNVLWNNWEPIPADAEIDNPYGIVPVIEFRSRPKIIEGTLSGRSELASVLSTQDQINKLVCDMLIASEFAAFRQRWATGVEEPTDPATGQPIGDAKMGISRLLATGNETAKFGTFESTDLDNYVKAIENRVQSLASRTRTPPHYLLGSSGSFPSGESLKSTETGLIAKVRSRQRHFGESWEEVMRLCFTIVGDEARASAIRAETIWADPESRSESEHVDALVKLKSLNVPNAILWEKAGFSQTEIASFSAMMLDEALQRMLSGQPAIAPPAPITVPAPAPV